MTPKESQEPVAGRGGIGSHTRPNRGATDTWLTPKEIVRALGPFDLDPCAAPEPRPWWTALRHIALPLDGLMASWNDERVWLNPPYGSQTGKWLKRLAAHGKGTALVFARTETKDWHEHIWPEATGVLFLEGRLHFHYPTGARARANAGGPSALIAYGEYDAARLAAASVEGFHIKGHYIDLTQTRKLLDAVMAGMTTCPQCDFPASDVVEVRDGRRTTDHVRVCRRCDHEWPRETLLPASPTPSAVQSPLSSSHTADGNT